MLNIDNSSWQLPLYQIKIVFEFSIFRTKLPCTLFAFYLGFDACAPLAYKNSELSCCVLLTMQAIHYVIGFFFLNFVTSIQAQCSLLIYLILRSTMKMGTIFWTPNMRLASWKIYREWEPIISKLCKFSMQPLDHL